MCSLEKLGLVDQNRLERNLSALLLLRTLLVVGLLFCCLKKKRKIRTHLDLLSIPQLGGGDVKTLGGIEGCKYKTSSWHLNGFPDGNYIGSTVY